MDRLAVGIMIALAALAMSGGLMHQARAGEPGAGTPSAAISQSPQPAASNSRSERVLSLVLTLDALRAAPGLLDTSKV